MPFCGVKWCGKSSKTSNFQKDGITFHRFPQCPERKSKWIDAAHRGDLWFPSKFSVICSKHFSKDNFYPLKNRRRLMDTAVPTLHLPVVAHLPSTVNINQETHDTLVTGTSSAISVSVMQDLEEPSTSQYEEKITGTPITKRRRPLTPIAGTPSAYGTPVKKRLCRRIIELKHRLKTKNVKLKKLRDSNKRLRRKIISLKSLLSELETKNLITAENSVSLDSLGVSCKEIVRRQMMRGKSGKIGKKYSPKLRAFALTLNFYSTKAYNYVRQTFNSCLPSVKTLGKWYQSVDGHPGFTKEAFQALKFKAEQSQTPIHCCIVFDEMKIESKVEKTYGYVDFGGSLSIDSDCKEECTDALVFLVVSLHGKWKVPIGYFLIRKLNADQKVFLLTEEIKLCNEANVIVKAVTFDGCPANLAMAKKLGCSLDPDNLKTVFKIEDLQIAIFPDPAHMVKLVRNCFQHYNEFHDVEGNSIQWSHIESLHKLQEDEKFHAANKLRAEHLSFKKNIMKVKLATQIFRRSVAIALLFCKNTLKLKQFDQIEGTAKMLLTLNDLFDILDSKVHGYGLKRALNLENADNIIARLESCKDMLMTLTVDLDKKRISPAHFLIGRPFTSLPAPCLLEHNTNRLDRYERLEQYKQHFWQRWTKEYICELQQRTKWRVKSKDLQLNDLVLLKDDSPPYLETWENRKTVSRIRRHTTGSRCCNFKGNRAQSIK
ncbi:unnamed protein product [Plutella xylostella]|uniref:(diamondback moth) hypothetical protein n=1 Tax=Plutella xylostella TaxID=51655 RepID=A0A8S4G9R8_PLUXY|nr:unnamed protein product [Plutella xylostella]